MNKLIKFIYRAICYLFYHGLRRWFYFFNYFIINLRPIFSGRIRVKGRFAPNQKVYVTGKGRVKIENNVSLGYKLGGHYHKGVIEIQPRTKDAMVVIKNNVASNNNLFICCCGYIEIGERCLIGHNVEIMDFEAHGISPDKRGEAGESDPVIINDNVWIGNNCIILKGTEIGKNSIIAAGAVVKGKLAADSIYGGVPAKLIKSIEADK